MSRPRALLAVVLACAGLAACAGRLDAPISPTLGEAFATMQAQVVPAAYDPRPPESSAASGVAAIVRYQTGQVVQPAYGATSALSANSVSTNSNGSNTTVSTTSSTSASPP